MAEITCTAAASGVSNVALFLAQEGRRARARVNALVNGSRTFMTLAREGERARASMDVLRKDGEHARAGMNSLLDFSTETRPLIQGGK
ncbi:MAG: hypothetical protein WAN11_27140 [Syntrophobacteraceae bacterium]